MFYDNLKPKDNMTKVPLPFDKGMTSHKYLRIAPFIWRHPKNQKLHVVKFKV